MPAIRFHQLALGVHHHDLRIGVDTEKPVASSRGFTRPSSWKTIKYSAHPISRYRLQFSIMLMFFGLPTE